MLMDTKFMKNKQAEGDLQSMWTTQYPSFAFIETAKSVCISEVLTVLQTIMQKFNLPRDTVSVLSCDLSALTH